MPILMVDTPGHFHIHTFEITKQKLLLIFFNKTYINDSLNDLIIEFFAVNLLSLYRTTPGIAAGRNTNYICDWTKALLKRVRWTNDQCSAMLTPALKSS